MFMFLKIIFLKVFYKVYFYSNKPYKYLNRFLNMESKRGSDASFLYRINSWRKEKKGLSAVVTNLLIILLVIVAIGIIWAVIRGLIQEGAEGVSMQQLNIDMNIEDVTFATNQISVKIMNSGQEPITGSIIIVETERESDRYERRVQMSSKQIMTFDLTYNKNLSEVESISVAPFYETDDEEYNEGKILDTYEITSSDLAGVETGGGTDDEEEETDPACTQGQDDCGEDAFCNASNLCQCEEGLNVDNCDGDWNTGCEVNLTINTLHCGECGNECDDERCGTDNQCNNETCEYVRNDTCEGSESNNCCPDYCSADLENDSYDLDCGRLNCTGPEDCGENANCTNGECQCISPWEDCDGDGNCTCNTTTHECTEDGCILLLNLNQVSTLSGLEGASDVYVDGNYSYVTASRGDALEVVNVTDKARPDNMSKLENVEGSSPYLDEPRSVHVDGSHAYIASYNDDTLEVVNIENPESPTHAGSISSDSGAVLEFPNSVYVDSGYAYVTSYYGDSLDIIDVNDPTNPTHVGTISHEDGGAVLDGPTSVYVEGNYAYVTSENGDALQIIDISTRSSPSSAATVENGDGGALLERAQDVHVHNSYAYVASAGSDSLEVINVGTPTSPTHAGNLTGPEYDGMDSVFATYLDFAEGNYLLASSERTLTLIDINEPTNPASMSSQTTMDGPYSVYVLDRYVYITSRADDNLGIYEISSG